MEFVAELDPLDRRVRPCHREHTSPVSVSSALVNVMAAVSERRDGPAMAAGEAAASPGESDSQEPVGDEWPAAVVHKQARSQKQEPLPALIAAAKPRESEDYHTYLRCIVSADATEFSVQQSWSSVSSFDGELSSSRTNSDSAGLDRLSTLLSSDAASDSGAGAAAAGDGGLIEIVEAGSSHVSRNQCTEGGIAELGIAAAVPLVLVKAEPRGSDIFEGRRDC